MQNNRATAVLHLSGCLLAALLGGCSSNPTTAIDISDSATVPTLRASLELPPRSDAPSRLKPGHALELGWSRAKGADSQTHAAGQLPIIIGGQTFQPPAELQHEYEFRFLELVWRGRMLPQDSPVGLEVTAGVAQANLDLTVSSPTRRATEELSNAGYLIGLGLLVPVVESLSAQARLSWFGAPTTDDVSDAVRFELYGVWSVLRNVALRAGYSHWRVKSDRGDSGHSSVKLRFSGPSLGLDIAF